MVAVCMLQHVRRWLSVSDNRWTGTRAGPLSLWHHRLNHSHPQVRFVSMVAVSPVAKVLVTGANGYLAVWVVKKFLEAGYSVRGTVRSLAKSSFLKDTFSNYGDRFELVVVEDITKDGAFDDAVRGVDAIAHTAS